MRVCPSCGFTYSDERDTCPLCDVFSQDKTPQVQTMIRKTASQSPVTSRLSSEALNQLIPLLGSLARLVARGSRVSEAQLRTLLLGVDLESDPAALEELKRWSQLLTALRERPSEDNRHATVEALMLRGLPEAPVLLAVDTVVQNEESPPPPKRLRASVERLDLGVLSPGQGATAEFEVQGGPGHVVVDSDQVWVTPQQFGAGVTRIRVEVKPLASGGTLWTTLKLLTASETLEVPVVAQWIPPLPPSIEPVPPTVLIPPGALVVAPDGSGDFHSLEEAVQKARSGATIYPLRHSCKQLQWDGGLPCQPICTPVVSPNLTKPLPVRLPKVRAERSIRPPLPRMNPTWWKS
jgi:hypothetical protein